LHAGRAIVINSGENGKARAGQREWFLFLLSAGCISRDRWTSVSQKCEFNALRNFSRESFAAHNSN
jgi:hypothetical protein